MNVAGVDEEIKEDECWDRIEVSTNERQASALVDENLETCWECYGKQGNQFIDVFRKKGVVVR